MIGDKLNETVSGLNNTTVRVPEFSNITSGPAIEQSRNIIKLGIQRYILQISQLIGVLIPEENHDLKLIEKYNNVDVPKVS